MTARKPIGTVASTLIVTGLAAGLFVLLLVTGGVFRRDYEASRGAATRMTPATTASTQPRATETSPAPAVRVSIDNFSFAPVELTVGAGTKVTWVNHDDVPHTVTADDKSFNSGALDTDDAFSHVFEKPGEHPYFCGLHSHMTGRVVVK
jgi:plastocyanin